MNTDSWALNRDDLLAWTAARRRPLAAVLAATAVLAVLTAAHRSAGAAASAAVLVVARGLPSGHVLTAADLRSVHLPARDVPADALTAPAQATGRLLSGAVSSGEPLTEARLVDPPRLAPGQLAVPVRLTDPGTAGLLSAGERIDLLVTTTGGRTSDVARGALILAVPGGGLILVAAGAGAAEALAGGARVSVALSGPSPR